jgi:hypothetical protein
LQSWAARKEGAARTMSSTWSIASYTARAKGRGGKTGNEHVDASQKTRMETLVDRKETAQSDMDALMGVMAWSRARTVAGPDLPAQNRLASKDDDLCRVLRRDCGVVLDGQVDVDLRAHVCVLANDLCDLRVDIVAQRVCDGDVVAVEPDAYVLPGRGRRGRHARGRSGAHPRGRRGDDAGGGGSDRDHGRSRTHRERGAEGEHVWDNTGCGTDEETATAEGGATGAVRTAASDEGGAARWVGFRSGAVYVRHGDAMLAWRFACGR